VRNASLSLIDSVVSNNSIRDGFISSSSFGWVNYGAGIALEQNFYFSAERTQITGNVDDDVNQDRSTTLNGAGISAIASSGASQFSLTNSTVSNNRTWGANSNGGGIYLETRGFSYLDSTIDRSTISGNSVYAGNGGGITTNSNGSSLNLTLISSTISGNTATNVGGGMFVTNNGSNSSTGLGTITMYNDTISSNVSYQYGGGIFFNKYNSLANPFELNLTHVTVTNNYANVDNVGNEGGGGIFASGDKVTLKNSIVAGNLMYGYMPPIYGHDVRGNFYMADYNHIGIINGGSSFVNFNATDTTGAAALGPLQNNGGPTLTHSPNSYGPLVDVIPLGVNGCNSALTTDQRGYPRPYVGSKCDKGAVEWRFPL
jgi:hypothetical protein